MQDDTKLGAEMHDALRGLDAMRSDERPCTEMHDACEAQGVVSPCMEMRDACKAQGDARQCVEMRL